MTDRWGTHGVELLADRVVKRFRSHSDGEHRREWVGLTLLDRYAPGLAPVPLRADLSADSPTVEMSRLGGAPLRGQRLSRGQLEAMAGALTILHGAVPGHVAARLPNRLWNQLQAVQGVRARWQQLTALVADPTVARAVAAGMCWLEQSELESGKGLDGSPVFGQADENLANFLWDGTRVRLVDFEDSGCSDRAYELADVVEHVSAWVDSEVDVPYFLDLFELSRGEAHRLVECRRLFALLWLLVLALEDPAGRRNPPGTAGRQAERLLALLD
ncbi:hypothetical protein KCMC57_up01950 [Kitasatospora sp. CMC57]|uniref:Aminoglycoside phosphotransferase domain-containing protein n=1 Tax=Kitasatospora sp. CMC57 TaxID=3231513 RepID=A0AB33JKE6_9ACTN